MYQLWLLKEGNWVEEAILEGKGRKSVVTGLNKKYRNGTWKVRSIA